MFGATSGLLVARWGARRCLIGALCLATALALYEATLPPLPSFLAARGLEGATHLALVVAAPTSLPALTAPRRHAIVLSLWGTFFSVAFLLAGAVGPHVVGPLGLRGWFALNALVIAALAVVAYAAAPADDLAPRARGSLKSLIAAHVAVYADARSALPALCFLCYTGLFLALQTLTPEIVPAESREVLVVGMPIVSIAATMMVGAMGSGRLTPFTLAILAFAGVIASSALLHAALAAGFAIVPAALLRIAFVSALPGAVYPMIPLVCPEPAQKAHAFGAIAQLGNVGSTLGPPIFNAAREGMGPLGMMAPLTVLCLAGISLAAATGRRFSPRRA